MLREAPDLLLLDLLLPGLDGIEVCRKLKMDPVTQKIPIIMVSAKGEESDIVLGLGSAPTTTSPSRSARGADRPRAGGAASRRAPGRDARASASCAALVIDAIRHEVRLDGESVTFTATEFRLLHLLASHPGRVFTRDQLVTRVIGDGAAVIDRNIDVHVRSIRKKLEEHRSLIGTVRGVGYRFQDEPFDD